jgi:glutamate dehydrogenase
VAGEGANLGFTQKGRIEFALAAGSINMDAVDNSAGVDLSDHEVNLKILLAGLERNGLIANETERDRLLSELTEPVCAEVIANNRRQSLCVSLDHIRCRRGPAAFLDVADRLENAGWLDRGVESFPLSREVLARPDQTLTRPELAVLMLYSKLALKQALLEAPDFLSEPALHRFRREYFPAALWQRLKEQPQDHPLAQEICVTALTNALVNQAGSGVLSKLDTLESAPLVAIVRAYLAFDDIVGGRRLRGQLVAAEQRISADRQYEYLLRLEDLLAECCSWTLAGSRLPAPASISIWERHFSEAVDRLAGSLVQSEESRWVPALMDLRQAGLDPLGAKTIALADRLTIFPVLADLAERTGASYPQIAAVYDATQSVLGLEGLEGALDRVAPRDPWEQRALPLLRRRYRSAVATLTRRSFVSGRTAAELLFAHRASNWRLERYRRFVRELMSAKPTATAAFFTLVTALEELVEAATGDSAAD